MKNPRRILAILSPFLMMATLSGCSILGSRGASATRDHAFIAYSPAPETSGRLRLAVKDNIDVKGVVTTAGSEYFAKHNPPAAKDAPCLAIARQRNVEIVGKANLSEFAVAPSGINEYFGTPKSPLSRWRKLIPGGSSSGSAVAVANGQADVAFGTDTAGSVRVPAACSGVVGLKTTHGLISIKGVHPIEPKHLDTVGPLAKDIAGTVQGMELLQSDFAGQYAAAKSAQPSASGVRVGRLTLGGTNARINRSVDQALSQAGFQVVPMGDDFRKKWEKATSDGYTLAAAGAWMSNKEYRFKLGIAGRTKAAILVGQIAHGTTYKQAVARQAEWQKTLRAVFKKVDFIALPTLQSTPPSIPPNLKIDLLEALVLTQQNTVAVNFAGNPALAMPIPLQKSNVRFTSLQLVGPRRSEAKLLNAGRFVENAVRKE